MYKHTDNNKIDKKLSHKEFEQQNPVKNTNITVNANIKNDNNTSHKPIKNINDDRINSDINNTSSKENITPSTDNEVNQPN